MKVFTEVYSKEDFEFWGQAVENVHKLTDEEFETYVVYIDEIGECEFNDLFAYGIDDVLECLGIDEEEFFNRR